MLNTEQLKRARRMAGYTQEQLAQALGVSRQAVSHWENGHAEPEKETVSHLAGLLGVEPGQLLLPTPSGGPEASRPAGPERPGALTSPPAECQLREQRNGDSQEKRRLPRWLWIGLLGLLALAVGAGLWLAPSSPKPSDFQNQGSLSCLTLSPMQNTCRVYDSLSGSRRYYRIRVLLQTPEQEGCTIESVFLYHFAAGALGRSSLRGTWTSYPAELRDLWGANTLLPGTRCSISYQPQAEGGDLGFGLEVNGVDRQGRSFCTRLWLPCE